MKILIVDDEPLARDRLRALINELGIGEVVAEAGNGRDVLNITRVFEPEIILLDVRMPGIDGIQVAQQLATLELYPTPVVIFTTAYGEHALAAFEYQAVDYLLKPINKDRLEQALQRAYLFLQSQLTTPPVQTKPRVRTHISYYSRGELRVVPVKQIYYFLAQQKYVVLRWTKGEILISESLKNLEQEFTGQFIRVHRRALVAVSQMAGLMRTNERSYLILKDVPKSLEVSRRHLQLVKQNLKDMRISYVD
ncbi:MAG: LytTR family DNA-binding domain-containing protein [Candidatus Parabeggiatoa sp.]|nr:LytTR family DNA-binding domain-containing protein [Candidatus Parabeggiatoa sp.]